MKLEIKVSEVKEIFKEIQERPEQIFEMLRLDIREIVGHYLTALMSAELTHFLGRGVYERGQGEVNHRNDSYDRNFTLKGIGEVRVSVPRDRKGDFKTCVIPRSFEGTARRTRFLLRFTQDKIARVRRLGRLTYPQKMNLI